MCSDIGFCILQCYLTVPLFRDFLGDNANRMDGSVLYGSLLHYLEISWRR